MSYVLLAGNIELYILSQGKTRSAFYIAMAMNTTAVELLVFSMYKLKFPFFFFFLVMLCIDCCETVISAERMFMYYFTTADMQGFITSVLWSFLHFFPFFSGTNG